MPSRNWHKNGKTYVPLWSSQRTWSGLLAGGLPSWTQSSILSCRVTNCYSLPPEPRLMAVVGREYLNSQNSDPLARMFAWISQNSAAGRTEAVCIYRHGAEIVAYWPQARGKSAYPQGTTFRCRTGAIVSIGRQGKGINNESRSGSICTVCARRTRRPH
jgi:hypothetical protein